MRHGKETNDHVYMKLLLAILLMLLGWFVLIENHCSDIVAWLSRPKRPLRILAGEAERSLRNASTNALRNFSNGCDAMLTLVSNEADRIAMRRHLKKHLPREIWTKVGIITIPQVERLIQRLQGTSSPTLSVLAPHKSLKKITPGFPLPEH